MKLRLSQPCIGTALSVAAAVLVTAQALSAPPRPYRAADLVSADERMSARLTDVCAMYPAECRFGADGSARVVGRRIVRGPDSAVLKHFRTTVGTVQDSWEVR
jgi:hypothetical protein